MTSSFLCSFYTNYIGYIRLYTTLNICTHACVSELLESTTITGACMCEKQTFNYNVIHIDILVALSSYKRFIMNALYKHSSLPGYEY